MSSEKITSLTPEQEIFLKEFYQKNLNVGRSIVPIDHEKAEDVITKLYKHIGCNKPNFHYFRSAFELIAKHPEVKLDNYFGGQQWVYWKAFYTFCETIGVKYEKENSELLALWMQEAEHLHWWFPYENDCIIIERPIKLSVNDGGFLHCENDKAIEYADGWGMYYLNGVKVNEYLVIECYRKLDPNTYTDVYNDIWLKRYITAQFKRQWGSNLSKFNGVTMLGGVTLNGDKIFTEAQTEIEKLEKEIRDSYEIAPTFMIG